MLDALNAGELVTAYDAVSQDCEYSTVDYSLVGRDAIESIDFAFFDRLESHWRRLEHLISVGETVVCWVRFGGTAKDSGRSFETEVCNVFKFANGKIVKWEMYGDFSGAPL